MTNSCNKQTVREELTLIRKCISQARRLEAQEALLVRLHPHLSPFHSILSFCSLPQEIDMASLNQLLASEGRLLLPKVDKERLDQYRNNLKNPEFDKEASQNSHLESATIVRAQGANEDENFEEKPTPSKTDSSSCFGIFHVTDLTEQLMRFSWNCLEPIPDKCSVRSIDTVDCVLVPALGFDRTHMRIGYGKGYYDKLIAHAKSLSLKTHFIGIGFQEQLCAEMLPVEMHDMHVNELLLF
jgi:5-formyltetrahydrofolate cyclo-ligase